jgi:hypothetical protein
LLNTLVYHQYEATAEEPMKHLGAPPAPARLRLLHRGTPPTGQYGIGVASAS